MAIRLNRLSVRQVQSIKSPGRHADGGGLYLVVTKAGTKRWAFLYRRRRDGKLSEMGLGGVTSVPLARARQKAAEARALLAAGQDPIKERWNNKSAAQRTPQFGEFSDKLIESLEGAFRSRKTAASWRLTMQVYAQPVRDRLVDDISTQDVVEILQPIWLSKAETATRVRARIEKTLDAAKAQGFRTGDNPARWRGHLDHLLPRQPSLQRGHHPAMPWTDVPAFVVRLQEGESVGALALEFLILTAARSGEILRSVRDGEVMGARWDEFNLDAKVWTVPARRMKAAYRRGDALERRRELMEAWASHLSPTSEKKVVPISDGRKAAK